MGEIIRSLPMPSVAAYHAFRDGRPEKERWELIDGVAMMMPPPRLHHQVLSANLNRLFEAAAHAVRPDRIVLHESGVFDVANDRFSPVPDMVVLDASYALDQVYVDRFYAVAEILSDSDSPALIVKKLAFCQAHEHCRSILLVEQDRIAVRVLARRRDQWTDEVLLDPEAAIVVPELGVIGAVADIYRRTPLMPA